MSHVDSCVELKKRRTAYKDDVVQKFGDAIVSVPGAPISLFPRARDAELYAPENAMAWSLGFGDLRQKLKSYYKKTPLELALVDLTWLLGEWKIDTDMFPKQQASMCVRLVQAIMGKCKPTEKAIRSQWNQRTANLRAYEGQASREDKDAVRNYVRAFEQVNGELRVRVDWHARVSKFPQLSCFRDLDKVQLELDDCVLWCSCRSRREDDLVECRNADCNVSWFHFACVGWYADREEDFECSTCKDRH
jgi:hypothetical protein